MAPAEILCLAINENDKPVIDRKTVESGEIYEASIRGKSVNITGADSGDGMVFIRKEKVFFKEEEVERERNWIAVGTRVNLDGGKVAISTRTPKFQEYLDTRS